MGDVNTARMLAISQRRIDYLQSKSPDFIERRGSAPGFPWGPYSAFGIMYIYNDKVKLAGGEIQVGDQVPVTCAALEMQLTVDYSKVGYEYKYSDKSFTIINFGASIVYEAGYFRRWLFEFRLISGVAYFNRDNILSPGLPGNYGDA